MSCLISLYGLHLLVLPSGSYFQLCPTAYTFLYRLYFHTVSRGHCDGCYPLCLLHFLFLHLPALSASLLYSSSYSNSTQVSSVNTHPCRWPVAYSSHLSVWPSYHFLSAHCSCLFPASSSGSHRSSAYYWNLFLVLVYCVFSLSAGYSP